MKRQWCPHIPWHLANMRALTQGPMELEMLRFQETEPLLLSSNPTRVPRS